jgi:hypothetical protein
MIDKKQKFGVGLGRALACKSVGNLNRALTELELLIMAGANPRYLTIVPVWPCAYCDGRGSHLNALVESACIVCNGFKFVVQDPASGLSPRKYNYDIRLELKK